MGRYALLMFNEANAPANSGWKDLKKTKLEGYLSRFKKILKCKHDEYDKFGIVPLIVDATYKKSKETMEAFFKNGSYTADDLLLFYYIGHGFKKPRYPLMFLNRNSYKKRTEEKSLYGDIRSDKSISFADLEACIENSLAGRIIIILDCCYSGAATGKFNLSKYANKEVYLITAVTGVMEAAIHTEEDIGTGAFSKGLLEGIETGAVIRELTGKVTFNDAFRYAKLWLEDNYSFQKPTYTGDSTIGDELIYRYSDTYIEGRIFDIDRRSVYRKVGKILDIVNNNPQKTEGDLYSFITKERPQEFLVWKRTSTEDYEYHVISSTKFSEHIRRCRDYGFIEGYPLLDLSKTGKAMLKENCTKYNNYLITGLSKYLSIYDIKIEDIKGKISYLITNGRASTARSIWEAFVIDDGKLIKYNELASILRLLSIIGVYRYTSKKNYLPAKRNPSP